MTPADILAAAGRALFGERWKNPLAAALKVRDVRIDDWLKDRGTPPPGVWRDIATMIEQRERELGLARNEIYKVAGPRTDGGVDIQGPHYLSNAVDSFVVDTSAYRGPDGRQTGTPSAPARPKPPR